MTEEVPTYGGRVIERHQPMTVDGPGSPPSYGPGTRPDQPGQSNEPLSQEGSEHLSPEEPSSSSKSASPALREFVRILKSGTLQLEQPERPI
jgi:hypothetical protein